MSRYSSSLDCKIYVGDLPKDATEEELESAFATFGPIKSLWVARNPAGFAFVEFEDARDAEDAVKSLDGSNICGVRVRVEFSTGKSKPKPWQAATRRGPPVGGRRAFNPDDRCYECGERGHYAYDCDLRRGKGRSSHSRNIRRSRSHSRDRSRSRKRHSRSRSNSRRDERKKTTGGRSRGESRNGSRRISNEQSRSRSRNRSNSRRSTPRSGSKKSRDASQSRSMSRSKSRSMSRSRSLSRSRSRRS